MRCRSSIRILFFSTPNCKKIIPKVIGKFFFMLTTLNLLYLNEVLFFELTYNVWRLKFLLLNAYSTFTSSLRNWCVYLHCIGRCFFGGFLSALFECSVSVGSVCYSRQLPVPLRQSVFFCVLICYLLSLVSYTTGKVDFYKKRVFFYLEI